MQQKCASTDGEQNNGNEAHMFVDDWTLIAIQEQAD